MNSFMNTCYPLDIIFWPGSPALLNSEIWMQHVLIRKYGMQYSKTCLEGSLPWETNCLQGPLIFGRSYIPMQLNLVPKVTCLERPYFYDKWSGPSRHSGCTVLHDYSTSLIKFKMLTIWTNEWCEIFCTATIIKVYSFIFCKKWPSVPFI